MAELVQIPQNPELPSSKDIQLLREQGLEYIRQYSSDVWTDHNLHDPGITLLETISYAITDLGFRLNLDIKDILASSHLPAGAFDFFRIRQILPTLPVNLIDFRKILIDLPEVKNAWIELAAKVDPSLYYDESLQSLSFTEAEPILLQGLYDVLVEMEEDPELGNLNTSILSLGGVDGLEVTLSSGLTESLIIEASFPFWDDESVAVFAEGATLDAVSINGGSINLLPTSDGDEYFADLTIDYNAGDSTGFGAIVKVISDFATEDQLLIQAAIESELVNTGADGPVPLLIRKIIQANAILNRVQQHLGRYRNLCEDFTRFNATRIQEIAITADLNLGPGVDTIELLASIFYQIDRFLSPDIQFYSFEEMKSKGFSVEEIFNGPLLDSGFIIDEELKGLKGRDVIFTSDLVRIILEQNETIESSGEKAIISVQNFSLSNFLNNQVVTANAKNCLNLIDSKTYKPRLSISKSVIRILRGGVSEEVDLTTVIQRFQEIKTENAAVGMKSTEPTGQEEAFVFQLDDYRSIQNDLPFAFGTAPQSLAENAGAPRHGKARQLKAYLLFFDQILAGFLAQLTHLRQMLSVGNTADQTYFYSIPSDIDLFDELTSPDYESSISDMTDQFSVQKNRRSRILDHLLARLGETLNTYESLRENSTAFNADKSSFLEAYGPMSQARANAGWYPMQSEFKLILQDDGQYTWSWPTYEEQSLLLSPEGISYPTLFEVFEAIDTVISRAGTPANYQVNGPAGALQIELQDTLNNPIAQSVLSYEDNPSVNSAIESLALAFNGPWQTEKRATVAKKICRLLGFPDCSRHNLWGQLENVFQIVPNGPDFGFLVEDSGNAPLFQSTNNDFPNLGALATVIYQVIEWGREVTNYTLTGIAPNLSFELRDETDQVVGVASATYPDEPSRENAITELVDLLTEEFTAETGFHLIEHILLRPTSDTDTLLSIHVDDTGQPIHRITDPYSFQLTVVLPAGATIFEDEELRELVEQTFYRELPAHVLPRILWLDIRNFHRVERMFEPWLRAYVQPNTPLNDLQDASNDLVNILNEVTQDVLDSEP